jgi:hypothetical protein
MGRRGRGVNLGSSVIRDWRYYIWEGASAGVSGEIRAEGWEESRTLVCWFEANKGEKVKCTFPDGSYLELRAEGIAVHESGHWSEAVMKVCVCSPSF